MPVGGVFMGKSFSYVMPHIRQYKMINFGLVPCRSCWLLKRHKLELHGMARDQFVQENATLTPKASLLLFRNFIG